MDSRWAWETFVFIKIPVFPPPPPHYAQLIMHKEHTCHTSVKCASKARSKQFSDKWLFLLRLISCLLLLLKKGEQIRSTFVWLFRMRTRGICANMVEVHLCVQEVKTGHKQDLQLTRFTAKLCKSRRLIAKMLATLWQQIPYGCSKQQSTAFTIGVTEQPFV